MADRRLKIFIGPNDAANLGALLAMGLQERGVNVTVACHTMRPYNTGMKYNIILGDEGKSKIQKIFIYLRLFLKVVFKYNVFIFISNDSLLPYNIDLPVLKLLGKKTAIWFVGSDIRHFESFTEAAKKAGIKYYASKDQGAGPEALKSKLRMIHKIQRNIDYIITGPSISHLLTREYIRFMVPLDVNNIRYGNTPNRVPMIVHAPTDDKFKGTNYVLEAIEQLKKEGYAFEFHLFREMSNIEVRKALSEADISIDQLFAQGPGMFALESMAAGCAVLGGNIPEFAGFSRELPIIHTDPDNVYQNIKMLLENTPLRQELGQKGRKYVEKYHDYLKIADDFIRLLNTGEAEQIYPAKQSVKEIVNQAKKVNEDL